MWYQIWWTLVSAMTVTQIAVFSTTIYLHRTATHKSLELHPMVAWFFRLTLWITTGISAKEWVAVHRKHHAFTDEEGDPHSPKLKGFWSVQLGNVFHYIKEARSEGVVERYARDVRDDVWDRLFFNYGLFGVSFGTVVLCLGMGLWQGLVVAGIHAVMYVFVLSSSVNGLCHHVGYRNFDNTATNIKIIALLTAGEGLHNNHHAYQSSPKFSWKPGEIDPAWPVIKLLTTLRLAHVRKTIEQSAL